MFKINVADYPKSANAYDSLGEAYMVDGNKSAAIENYKKSLELDPNNGNAREMLKKLEGN
jgi:cytochrome c-type biogenesis protein CcmH/NrfG